MFIQITTESDFLSFKKVLYIRLSPPPFVNLLSNVHACLLDITKNKVLYILRVKSNGNGCCYDENVLQENKIIINHFLLSIGLSLFECRGNMLI